MNFQYPPGATPIDEEEERGLIPAHLTLQHELNEYEETNLLEATEWLFSRRRGDPLDNQFVLDVHRRMFNHTWRWAGEPRRSDKNIGVTWLEIPTRLRQMLDDIRAQIRYRANAPAEIAARYHHRLVSLHIFPNGNGRHARLMADLLLTQLAGRRFEWGRGSLGTQSEKRAFYIGALQSADDGDYRALLEFLQIK